MENSDPWISTREKFPKVCGFHLFRLCLSSEVVGSTCFLLVWLPCISVESTKRGGFRLSFMVVMVHRIMNARAHQLPAREDCSCPPGTVLFPSSRRGLFLLWLTDPKATSNYYCLYPVSVGETLCTYGTLYGHDDFNINFHFGRCRTHLYLAHAPERTGASRTRRGKAGEAQQRGA